MKTEPNSLPRVNSIQNRPNKQRLEALAQRQGGYFTAQQASDCGFSWSLCSYYTRLGRFQRLRRGLYRLTAVAQDPTPNFLARWLSVGISPAVVSHHSALALHGLLEQAPEKLHVTIERAVRRVAPPGVQLHTTVHFPTTDEVAVLDEIPVTSPARSILDLAAGRETVGEIAGIVQAALDGGLTTPGELTWLADRYGGKARRLIRSLPTRVHLAAGGQGRSISSSSSS